MLSILIPTYNYNVFPLVKELHKQALQAKIPFEIIVLDDASPNKELADQNIAINSLSGCSYELLPGNIGRSAIRNLLSARSNYDWLLYLDSDTMPAKEDFIAGYLPHLDNEDKVVYGGILYQEQKPHQEMLLRWVYGNEREALSAEERNLLPHKNLLTLNFAIKKSVFEEVRFNEAIPNLRHEDTLFSYELQLAGIKVEHISNEVYHHGLESSLTFLRKTEESVVGFKYLLDNQLLATDYLKIGSTYTRFKKSGVASLAAIGFKATKSVFRKNLLGSNPSLFIFDLYRLGYLCSLK